MAEGCVAVSESSHADTAGALRRAQCDSLDVFTGGSGYGASGAGAGVEGEPASVLCRISGRYGANRAPDDLRPAGRGLRQTVLGHGKTIAGRDAGTPHEVDGNAGRSGVCRSAPLHGLSCPGGAVYGSV